MRKLFTFLLVLSTFFLFTPVSYAAGITVDATAGTADACLATGTTSVTCTMTVGVGATLLLFLIDANINGDTSNGVDWNGTTMTRITAYTGATGETEYIYGLLNPTSGSHTATFARTGSSSDRGYLISFTGTDSTTLPTIAGNNGASNAGTINTGALVTTVANSWIVGVFGNDFVNGITPSGSVTSRQWDGTNDSNSSRAQFDSNGALTTGSYTPTYTVGSGTGHIAIAAVVVQPPAAAASSFNFWQFSDI